MRVQQFGLLPLETLELFGGPLLGLALALAISFMRQATNRPTTT